MTTEDILHMARDSHLDVYGLGKDHKKFMAVLKDFSKLVAAAEREACAKLCDELQDIPATEPRHCAQDIRARGQA